MDRRLLEAARTGNIEYLFQLIERDPSIFDTVTLCEGETPLHIACIYGHLSFVKEMINLKPEFAEDLNQDGFSPLHIASAKGHTEIVREVLKVSKDLCLIKGKEKRVPLHYAAVKGKLSVLQELLSACRNSIEEVTARGETALHLAVKNNQFEAFEVLVEHLKMCNLEHVLNMKDDHGCTILHLAAAKKQYEVIDFVLNEHNITKGAIEVNASNTRGLKPLDVLLLFQSQAGDREIEQILRRAGASSAEDLHHSSPPPLPQTQMKNQTVTEESRPPSIKLFEYLKFKRNEENIAGVRNTLLIVVTIVATATYQAGLNPPRGVWQDTNTSSTPPHYAGKAILDSQSSNAYNTFLFCNTFGFSVATNMMQILTAGFPLQRGLCVLILALSFTYGFCIGSLAMEESSYTQSLAFFAGMGIPYITNWGILRLMRTHYLKDGPSDENARNCWFQ